MDEDHYRNRIYEKYASVVQGTGALFDTRDAARRGPAYQYYLREWLPGSKDAAILDAACGGGGVLHFLKACGYRNLSGVDISREQVKLARQVVPKVFEGNLLSFLEEHVGIYDLITGLDIVEHMKKDEALRFLDFCYAALKPSGRLILQTPNAESPMAGAVRYGDFTHEICFTAHSLSNLMQLSGFKEIETREQLPVPYGYSFFSTMRFALWRCLRLLVKGWNIIETGQPGSGIYTRVFLISGVKQL